MKNNATLVLVVCTFVTVMIAGCTSSSNPSSTPVISTSNQNTVSIQNYAFSPALLTIPKGANVTWKNDDTVQHTIVSDTQVFTSPLINQGDTYTFQFNDTGTFAYHCSIHPYMTGRVTVV